MKSSRRRLRAVAVLAAVLVIAACDNTSDSNAPNATESTTKVDTSPETAGSSTTASESTAPTESSGSSSGPASTKTPTPTTRDNSPARRAKASQVTAAALPGFNADWLWDKADGRAGQRPTSPGTSRCLRASLTAIGGVVEYSTAYTVAGDAEDEAVLTTAVFPDERTAVMAESVLAKWLKTCRPYLASQPGVSTVGLTTDRVTRTIVGPAHSRLLGFGPVQGDRDSTYFNGEGYVRDGDVISYLVMHSVGQDYNYDVAREPVTLGLRAAAVALKRSR